MQIVHVSAKDLGTGNEQKITLTASSNLSDADIEKAVKEAEAHASDDKKRKEDIETRNKADSMVYQSEKTLKDLGDKLDGEEKVLIEKQIETVKEALKGSDNEAINKATEELTQAFYKASEKIYKGQPHQGFNPEEQTFGAAGPEPKNENDNVYEADYKVVDEDKK